MSRKLDEQEIRIWLARVGDLPPDDVAGYVVVLTGEHDVIKTITNANNPGSAISVLARAIEHAAVQVQEDAS